MSGIDYTARSSNHQNTLHSYCLNSICFTFIYKIPMYNFISVTKKSLYIRMDKETLLKACTELVTINGRPLTIFKDSGMQKILNPITQSIGNSEFLPT